MIYWYTKNILNAMRAVGILKDNRPIWDIIPKGLVI